jgi:hypothetical protein
MFTAALVKIKALLLKFAPFLGTPSGGLGKLKRFSLCVLSRMALNVVLEQHAANAVKETVDRIDCAKDDSCRNLIPPKPATVLDAFKQHAFRAAGIVSGSPFNRQDIVVIHGFNVYACV